MPTILVRDAVEFICGGNDGKFFSVEFIKRTTGELRVMACKRKVLTHLKGGEPAYDFDVKDLICVFDITKKAYRSIPKEGIVRVKIDGEWYDVVSNKQNP